MLIISTCILIYKRSLGHAGFEPAIYRLEADRVIHCANDLQNKYLN